VYRKLILSSPEARAKIMEQFGKSGVNAVRNYKIYSRLLKRQAAFIAALSFTQWWHTGEINGREVAISWLSFALAGAVIESGADFMMVKMAGRAWRLKNLTGPWGWIATAVELGMTLLFAYEIEQVINNVIETGQRVSGLQEKSLGLYELASNEGRSAEEVIAYFNHEYHPEFKAFRDVKVRDLYLANVSYLKEFENFRREHDLLYKANLEKEALESEVNDAERNFRSPVAPRESLLSPTFPTVSRMFGHKPDLRDYGTMTQGGRHLTMLRLVEIPELEKDTEWKEEYERKVQGFEADREIEFGNMISSLKEENLESPLTKALLRYQESAEIKDYETFRKMMEFSGERSWGDGKRRYDTGVSITKIGIFKEIEDVRRLTATDNLLQEIAYAERMAKELSEKEKTERNGRLIDFFTKQAISLRIELMQMIHFLNSPFEMNISEKEEAELEEIFNNDLSMNTQENLPMAAGF
jgi:hypothetical protein